MPDYTIASQVQTPDAMKSISGVLNFARGAQDLQTQRQSYQRDNIQLQKEQQANQERIALQKFMSNPDNFQTNGRIDLDKVNKAVPSIAPLTGSEMIGKLSALAKNQTDAIEAKQNLTQSQRAIVAGPIGVLGRAGVTDPKVYIGELQKLKETNPDNPDLHRLIDAYSNTLSMTPAGGNVAKTAITASQSLMGPREQQTSLSPQVGLTNTGGAVQETITTPSVGGNAPSISMTGRGQPLTLGPGQREEMSTDVVGNKIIVTKDEAGKIVSTRAADGSGGGQGGAKPVLSLPPGDREAIPTLTAERAAVNNAAAQVPTQHFNNQQIIKLAPSSLAGTGSDQWSKLFSANGLQWLPGKETENFQRLAHFMALQAQSNAQAMGAGTDAARMVSEQATGSTKWTPQAIIATTRVNDALATGVDLFNRGMESAIKAKNGNVIAKRDFQNAWSQNFDVRAMELHNAIQSKDSDEVARIVKDVGGRGSPQAQDLIRKVRNLEKLSSEGKL